MTSKDILDEHWDEISKIIFDMVTAKIDELGYDLRDRQWEHLYWHDMTDDVLKKEISLTNTLKELTDISDHIVDNFRKDEKFHFSISRLREEGYHPKLFDPQYIDFTAYCGKLDNVDIDYTFKLSDMPKNYPFEEDEYDRFMRGSWEREFYIIVHENGECVVILDSEEPDEELFKSWEWLRNVEFVKLVGGEIVDFFDRNKDVPVKYKF